MKASKVNPIYTAYIIHGNKKYDITPAIESLEFSDQKKQMAQSVSISLYNVIMGETHLSKIFDVRDRVFVYADDGDQQGEVFRGFVWSRGTKETSTDRTLTLKCYDNLIYFQESEESEYFSAGKTTKDIVTSICSKWGVSVNYSYESITHSKMALRGTLSNVITSDILDQVKKQKGLKYVVRSEKDVLQVKTVGQNSIVYFVRSSQNLISASYEKTMDGMTTKVVILGKADDNDRRAVEATISGDTGAYGTLQKIINRDENTSLADAKKEAQTMVNEDGQPKREYQVRAMDIPWIRKGDKVKVSSDLVKGYYIVNSLDRDISNTKKTMTLTLEDV